jgi:large-conductance mechanosensitive channel
MDLISSLKPNKINIGGTIALLVADWVTGFISKLIQPMLIARPEMRVENFTNPGFANFTSQGIQSGALGNYQLLSTVINYIILAILFYAIISTIIALLIKQNK